MPDVDRQLSLDFFGELWNVEGFIDFRDERRTFIHFDGAKLLFPPQCNIPHCQRTELVHLSLLEVIWNQMGFTHRMPIAEEKLVISCDPQDFQCPLMPKGQSAFPLSYVSDVDCQTEMLLFDEVANGRDPRRVEVFRETIQPQHLEFFAHMLGIGAYRRKCIPCHAAVAAYRARHARGIQDYRLFDGHFDLVVSATLAAVA